MNARLLALTASVAAIITSGTIFFHLVEGWSWVDSYFFSVVTLSTVGYGSLVPVTALGKIGTTIFIFLGLGVFAVAIQQLGSFAVHKREEWFMARLGNPDVDDQTDVANEDTQPRPD